MSRTLQLATSANAVLDENGNGTVTAGPDVPGVTWNVTLVTCATTSVDNEPTFVIYFGQPIPQFSLGGTYSGNSDANDISLIVPNGQVITGQWTGGDPGATGTFTLFGTYEAP
jgi:hypothetical protein